MIHSGTGTPSATSHSGSIPIQHANRPVQDTEDAVAKIAAAIQQFPNLVTLSLHGGSSWKCWRKPSNWERVYRGEIEPDLNPNRLDSIDMDGNDVQFKAGSEQGPNGEMMWYEFTCKNAEYVGRRGQDAVFHCSNASRVSLGGLAEQWS